MQRQLFSLLTLFILCSIPIISNDSAGFENISLPSTEANREWNRLGYDDNCSYYFPRSSPTFEPSDSPFDIIIDNINPGKPRDSIWPWARTGNLDQDEDLEIVIMGNDTLYSIEKTGVRLWKVPLPIRSELNLLNDVDGDGISEIFVSTKGTNQSKATINVFNNRGDRIKEIVLKIEDLNKISQQTAETYDFMTQVWAVKDLNNDGRKEIIITLHTGYDKYPRGILSVDYENENLLWFYPEACHVTNVIFPDLDNDGTREIVFGTTASKNGGANIVTQTNDFNSYIFALNHRGIEQWKYKVTPNRQLFYYYTMVASSDVDKDGDVDVICYKGVQRADESIEEGDIFFLDKNGNFFGDEIETGYHWVKPAGLYDLDNDGNLEAVVQTYMMEDDPLDHLLIVDLNTGKIEYDIEIPGTKGRGNTFIPAGINDLNGDGEIEIIICTHQNSHLMVFDSKLNLIWEHSAESAPGMAILSDIIPGGVNEILIINDRIRLFSLDIDVNLDIISPKETIVKSFPDDEIEFKVRLENSGNQSWIIKMAMIREHFGSTKLINSMILKTPEPGKTKIYSFYYQASEYFSDTNISIVINSTYISNGINQFKEKVTWRVLCFDRSLLKRMIHFNWNCTEEIACREVFIIHGDIEIVLEKDSLWDKKEVLDFLVMKTRSNIHIYLDENTEEKEIPPVGGEFSLRMISPDEPGQYDLTMKIIWENVNFSVSDSRKINIRSDETVNSNNYLLLIPIIICIGIFAIIGFILRKKKILFTSIPPLFHRHVTDKIGDHPTRKNIHRLIEMNPGITITELMTEARIKNRNTVLHHLATLEDRQVIKSRRDPFKPKIKLYYSYDFSVINPTYLSEGERLIIKWIRENPSLKRRNILVYWPYSQPYLTRCLKELQEKGYIIKKPSGELKMLNQEEKKEDAIVIEEMENQK